MTRVGYVLKVYPRFSETFVVTEILAREAHGDDLRIYALRPTTDARFHPEIARVQAEVSWVPRPGKASEFWPQVSNVLLRPEIGERFLALLPHLAELPADEVAQGLWLAEAVLEDGIEYLHAHFASLAGRMAWLAGQLTGVPYSITTHAKDIYHESVDMEWLRRICGAADRVIAISQFNDDYLRRVLDGTGARISLQYNALELDRFGYREPAAPVGPLKISAVGRLVPKKGFGDLIDAAARVNVPVEVDIAGSGELRDELQDQIERLGLNGRVRLLGPLTQGEVSKLVAASDVFVAPCVPAADGNIDGLPTVVLEAMALGTPVIATAVSGLPEVVRDGQTGILLNPGDVAGLAAALEKIAAGRVPLAELTANARTLIEEQFDSRRQAAQLAAWASGVEGLS
ncbi:MAG: glycosyltransferase family 4 protein [Propionibacteriaceae bacterium]|nr:glycosyltransferase family 4 protein [Propionibacteriaceae bacterium]